MGKRRGFSLIEILIALLILSVTIGPVLFSLTSSKRSIVQSARLLEATVLGQNLLERLKLVPFEDFPRPLTENPGLVRIAPSNGVGMSIRDLTVGQPGPGWKHFVREEFLDRFDGEGRPKDPKDGIFDRRLSVYRYSAGEGEQVVVGEVLVEWSPDYQGARAGRKRRLVLNCLLLRK